MSTSDLQDKLSNSNLDNWFILPINGSPISWTRGSYSSDIDHALVNSSMLDKISSAYFVSLKILTKIVTDRISKYAFRNNFIRPNSLVFAIMKNVSVSTFQLEKFVKEENLKANSHM